jgi:hypothetical protein
MISYVFFSTKLEKKDSGEKRDEAGHMGEKWPKQCEHI